jgi:hypothetical protein
MDPGGPPVVKVQRAGLRMLQVADELRQDPRLTTGWQQFRLETALRGRQPGISRSFDVLLRARDRERERVPSNMVDCRRRVREEPILE